MSTVTRRVARVLRIWAPGRVNLIGDHTDYTGGLCLPFALPLGILFELEPRERRLELRSDLDAQPCNVELPVDMHAGAMASLPRWARYVAATAAELGSTTGVAGTLTSTLPTGAGLSSSAALCVGTALALEAAAGRPDPDRLAVAGTAQRAELIASGVPCGLLDQLAIALGAPGAAVLIDCRAETAAHAPVPEHLEVWIVHSGIRRELAGSEYATRRAECEAAERVIGPLRDADLGDVASIDDEVLRRRARHVVSENRRVLDVVDALAAGDLDDVGRLLVEGHRSLSEDFDTSTPDMDRLVDRLCATDGVLGARMTGGGFGGCAVVLTKPGVDPTPSGLRSWRVRPSAGATVERY